MSPLWGGAASSLVLLSLLVSARYSGDTATALLFLHQSVSAPSPPQQQQHRHHSPTFLTSQSAGRKFWERKVKQEEPPLNLQLMVFTLVVWSLLLLLTLLLRSLPRLRMFLRFFHLLVLFLSSALLLKTLAGADLTQLWSLVRPDLTAVSRPETWRSALVLAGLSTNLVTGAASLTRGKVGPHINSNILTALASHLGLCLVFSLAVLSVVSEGGENVFLLLTESQLPPGWVQTALVLAAVLGLHSLLVTVSLSLSVLQQTCQSSARLYPSLVCLLLLTLCLSLLPHWAGTKHYSREVASWAVETFSFLLQALVVASLVWGVGLDNISQRISSTGGGELGRFYKFYATLAPLALLLVTAFIAVQDIDKRDLTVGCSVFLVMTVSLFLSSAVLVIDKVRREKQKHLAWRQIWLEEILGRRSEEVRDNSLTNSYRKFERCDLTSASIMKIKTNHWQYRNKDGIF